MIRLDSPQLHDANGRGQLSEILEQLGYSELAQQLTERHPPLAGVPATSLWHTHGFRATPPATTDWPTMGGASAGRSVARIEESTLLPRWRQSLIGNPWVRQALRELQLTFEDEGSFGLSVLSAVGSDEILVARTLSNLTAVNVRTGQTVWRSHDWNDPYSATEGTEESVHSQDLALTRDFQNTLNYSIRSRLTAGGSLGSLSADSRSVYALAMFPEERPPLQHLVQSGYESGEPGTTYLIARDLHTGRIVWRAGGPSAEVPPGLPAAGTFFFGPPTPDGDELFAVGERNGDVLLYCLEAETGFVRWEQLLAAAGRRLESDLARQSWAAPVGVRGSLVVCSTTTGWLTAVDRVSHRLLWSIRLVPRDPVDPDSPDNELAFDQANREASLNERWPPLQPILLRNRVIVAPVEFPDEMGNNPPKLLCYDLHSGTKLWELPKESLVGVIGATEEYVFVFDRQAIRAVSVSTGVVDWTVPVEEALAGRPLLTQSGIAVPTQAGTIWQVDPTSGKVIHRQPLGVVPLRRQLVTQLLNPEAPRELALGNLHSLGGRLVSVSPAEMIAFEWKTDEAQWQTEAATNAVSAIRWAQTLALRGQYTEAIQTLEQSAQLANSDAALVTRHRQCLLSVLTLQLEAELQGARVSDGRSGWLNQARSLASTRVDREAIQRLGIELAIQAREWESAWSLVREALRQPMSVAVELDDRTVHPDGWLADQILRLGQSPEPTARDSMRSDIHEEFQALWTAAAKDPVARQRLLRLFAETPFVDRAEFESLSTDDRSGALPQWQALSTSRDRFVADWATLRLLEQLANPDWVGEARRRLVRWPTSADWPQDLRTARETLEKQLSGVVDVHLKPNPSWLGSTIQVQRHAEESGSPDRVLPLIWIGEPCEALLNFRYRYDDLLQKVTINRTDGSHYGEFLLASNDSNPVDESAPVLYGAGLTVYLVHMGMIHAFSLPDTRPLWRRQTEHDSGNDPHWYNQADLDHLELHSPQSHQLQSYQSWGGSGATVFEVANSRQLVTRTRRGIEVLDAIHGQVLWSLPRWNATTVRCDDDRLLRLSGKLSKAYAIRSGRPLAAPDLSEFEESLTPLDAGGLTTLREQPGDGLAWQLEHFRLSSVPIAGATDIARNRWDELDLLQLESVWSQPVASHCLLGAGPPGLGVWIEKSGDVQFVEWASGRTQSVGQFQPDTPTVTAPKDAEPHVFAHYDRSHLYLSTHQKSDISFDDDCPGIPVRGSLSVHSRDRSHPDWQVPSTGLLLTQSLDDNPCLALLRLEELPLGDITGQRVHLTLLDKGTGQTVHQLDTPNLGQGAYGCHFDPITQRWHLFLEGERLQLQPLVIPASP